MGRRGPLPAPTALKLLRGETHRDRLNFDAPRPRSRRPTMPRDMGAEARAVWRRVLRDMPEGAITAVDGALLRCYCEAVADHALCSRLLATSGPLVRGARGRELVRNPLLSLIHRDADAIRLLARDLGLSPAARAALHIEYGPARGASIDDEIGPPARFRPRPAGGPA